MSDYDNLGGFEDRMSELDHSFEDATAVAAAFDGELRRMREGMLFAEREAASLGDSVGNGLRRSFDDVAFEGGKLSDALKNVARSMANAAYSTAIKPVQNALETGITSGVTSLVSGLFGFSHGGAFTQGQVVPFARGGIVTAPTSFPMRGATGLMGEAGPEAIMPLARGADGRLGVRMSDSPAARPVQVVMNISTPDAESFRRSRAQVASDLNRALSLGQRNR
ncbi:MAG: phage tail tape measure protein [Pseudomonadota bacterium]